MYRVEATRTFQDDLKSLDRTVASIILEKSRWLAHHPETARFPVQHVPSDLRGLQKYRIGDYRLFFWIDRPTQIITLYRVLHRSVAYKRFR